MLGNKVLAWAGLTFTLAACADRSLPMSNGVFASVAQDGATNTSMALHAIRSNECNGELVELSGTIHLVSQQMPDGGVLGLFNYQDVTGLGLSSGTHYRVSAVDQVRLDAPFPSSIQSVRHIRLIAQGAENNVMVDAIFHITVTANGDVTAELDELTTRCAG